jgi:hypothetical protein
MSKRQIEQYFDRYSQNWGAVRRAPQITVKAELDIDDIFICPLCYNGYFTRESLKHELLSLEHVPPKALGGTIRTLTCKDCNSQHGTELDSHLVKKTDLVAAFSGQSPTAVTAQITINSVTLPVNFFPLRDGGIRIFPAEPVIRNNKQQIDAFTEQFTSRSTNFKISYKIPNERHANLAVLRAAYLWAFSAFGYGFLINPHLLAIREQLKNPSELILPTSGVFTFDFPDKAVGLNIITSPAELRSFLVVFDVQSKNSGPIRYGTVLPGRSAPGLNIYQWLSQQEKKLIKMEITNILSEPIFALNDYPLESLHLWHDFIAEAECYVPNHRKTRRSR